MRRTVHALVVALTLCASGLYAQPLPRATPESVGISTERLGRMHAGMQALVDSHQVGGLVTLVARDGKLVDLQAFGFQDVDAKTPMKTDSIFRIASMSKPITSVAVMMLFEEGKLALTDPVSRFIPAFRDMKVLTRGAAGHRADARACPATDHDPRSPDAPVRTHLRVPGQRAGRQRLSRRRRQRRTHGRGGAAGREHRPARQGAAREPARRRVALQPQHRRARPGRRSRVGHAASTGSSASASSARCT